MVRDIRAFMPGVYRGGDLRMRMMREYSRASVGISLGDSVPRIVPLTFLNDGHV